MEKIIWILLSFLLSGIFWYVYFYRKEKRLLDRLQRMVDEAAKGTFCQKEISEEKVSALENSLKRLLDDSLTAEENQKNQRAVIQELISDIAHQTLTPISNLKLYTELLCEEQREQAGAAEDKAEKGVQNVAEQAGTEDAAEDAETAATILEQAEKLDFLVHSLVKLSRLESGLISVKPRLSPVSELMQDAAAGYLGKAEEKGISLKVHGTDQQAFFDPKWTGEALGNLIDNAVKYTNAGGSVELLAESYTFFVRVDVSDTGIGIAEEEIPKIFGRFYRSLSVSDQPGTGIGLHLVREIIQSQKGYIRVRSEPGKGSVFSVFLPLEQSTNIK